MVEKELSVKNSKILKTLNLIGDPNRLKIICFIFNKKNVCVSDIATSLGLSVATASHHLRVLSGGELVDPVRNGKRICYRFSGSKLAGDIKKIICKYK
ncbi:MAG: ArsR/SmtB family transcription factor [Minisyncoccota bacterium]